MNIGSADFQPSQQGATILVIGVNIVTYALDEHNYNFKTSTYKHIV